VITFTRAPTVAVGDPITSTQLAKLAAGFNDRLRSGLGDGAWRLIYYWLSLFRQARNPAEDGLTYPALAEFFTAGYQVLNPADGSWPIAGPGDPEGANLACQIMSYVWGAEAANLYDEATRLTNPDGGGLSLSPSTNATELWQLAKQQRGAFDLVTGAQGSPAWDAARSHYRLATAGRSPHGNAYGGFLPSPNLSETACADPDDADDFPPPPNYQIHFTALKEGLSDIDYDGTCRPVSGGNEYPTHVAWISYMPWAYYVFFNDPATPPDILPTTDYLEGPYTGEAQLRKTSSNALSRILNAFAGEFRGSDTQRQAASYWLQEAFDTQRFLTSQYHLAPNIGTESGGGVTEEYPLFRFTPQAAPWTLEASTLGTHTQSNTDHHDYHADCVLTGCLVTATKLQGTCLLELLDSSTVLQTITLTADELGDASLLALLPSIASAPTLKVRLATAAQFQDVTGKIEIECTELQERQPNFEDLFLVLRAGGALSSTTMDGRGIDEDQARVIGEHYFQYGCITNAHGAVELPGQPVAVNNNAVFDVARRLSQCVRIIPRQQFVAYAVQDGKSICWFKRYATIGGVQLDMFKGIAGGPPSPATLSLSGPEDPVMESGFIFLRLRTDALEEGDVSWGLNVNGNGDPWLADVPLRSSNIGAGQWRFRLRCKATVAATITARVLVLHADLTITTVLEAAPLAVDNTEYEDKTILCEVPEVTLGEGEIWFVHLFFQRLSEDGVIYLKRGSSAVDTTVGSLGPNGIRHTAPEQGWTNEWLMGVQLKAYKGGDNAWVFNDGNQLAQRQTNPAENSSLWKPESYSDYWALVNRCHFYSPEIANDSGLLWHTSYGMRVEGTYGGVLAPESPSGWDYAFLGHPWLGRTNVNQFYCGEVDETCKEWRRNFYRSCRIYEPDPEIDCASIEMDGETELVKLTFTGRFHHAASAPASIARDLATWDKPALRTEASTLRTVENALREYLVHQDDGTNATADGPGNNAANAQIQSLPDNPYGSVYPHFLFTKLIESPYADDNDDQNSWDTPFLHDQFTLMELYLRAMCEGYIDGMTSADYACQHGTVSYFDFSFENLCYQAFGNRWFTLLPTDLRPDNPQGFGPLPNTEAYAAIFNQFSSALNLLTRVRVMLPMKLETWYETAHAVEYVTPFNSDGTPNNACDSGTCALYYDGIPPDAAVSWTTPNWVEAANPIQTYVNSTIDANCQDGQWGLTTDRLSVRIRWQPVDPDALLAIPESWRDMLDSHSVFLASILSDRYTLTRNLGALEDSAECCDEGLRPCHGAWPDGNGQYWAFPEAPGAIHETICQVMPSQIEEVPLENSTHARKKTADDIICTPGPKNYRGAIPIVSDSGMVEIPLV
jgi:hypothetical protein